MLVPILLNNRITLHNICERFAQYLYNICERFVQCRPNWPSNICMLSIAGASQAPTAKAV